MPVLLALERWKQEDRKFNDTLVYLGSWSSAWDTWNFVMKRKRRERKEKSREQACPKPCCPSHTPLKKRYRLQNSEWNRHKILHSLTLPCPSRFSISTWENIRGNVLKCVPWFWLDGAACEGRDTFHSVAGIGMTWIIMQWKVLCLQLMLSSYCCSEMESLFHLDHFSG